MAGRTTFMIAHRLSTLQQADQILVLQQGRLVEYGPPGELLRRDGLYRQLHEAQVLSTASAPALAPTGETPA
jgi:ABC-type multidrug transport system fused ATPase/permease subunit